MMKSSGNNSQTLSGLPENSGAPFADYEYRLNELYPKAVELAEAEGIISISRLQRKFRIGWNTAATLKEKM
ncbi:DNA translocase FtsK, partial [Escherichia coli]